MCATPPAMEVRMHIDRRTYEISLARKGLSSIAVAHEIGVHHTTLSRWVRGWYPVPLNFRSRLAEVLELPEKELFVSIREAENG